MEGPGQLPYQDQSTPVDEGGRLAQPWPDTSAIQPVMSIQSSEDQASASARAAMEPWVSYVHVLDTGRPGSAQHTVTRVHCPQCNKSLHRHMKSVHKCS